MGGFVLDISPRPEITPLTQGRTRLVLTIKGLEWIAKNRPDLIPDISAEHIQDKSKANQFAKALVCIQATYFCFNFITRLCLGLAVTLLEINTFAHAACALFIYLIWWDKPLDIDLPVLIPVENHETASICAAMYLGSKVGQIHPASVFVDQDNSNASEPPTHRRLPSSSLFERIYARVSTKPIVYVELDSKPLEGIVGDEYGTHHNDDPSVPTMATGFRIFEPKCRFPAIAALTQLEILRQLPRVVPHNLLFLRRSAVSTEHGRSILAQSSPTDREYDKQSGGTAWVDRRMSNGPGATSVSILFQFIAASTIYGSWHLIAWNGPFHGRISEILWRLSALDVAASGVLIGLLFVSYFVFDVIDGCRFGGMGLSSKDLQGD